MAKILSIGDRLKLTVEGRTDREQRAKLDRAPNWLADPPGLVELVVAPGGLTAAVLAVAPGDCTLRAVVDGLEDIYAISVLPGAATRLVITAEEIKG